jgi:hypothetical protein
MVRPPALIGNERTAWGFQTAFFRVHDKVVRRNLSIAERNPSRNGCQIQDLEGLAVRRCRALTGTRPSLISGYPHTGVLVEAEIGIRVHQSVAARFAA